MKNFVFIFLLIFSINLITTPYKDYSTEEECKKDCALNENNCEKIEQSKDEFKEFYLCRPK